MTAKQRKMTRAQEQFLIDRFMGQFADKRNNPRFKKSETLFELARRATGGAIVELGTYHGNGAISLAWGAQAGERERGEKSGACPVHTVDPYLSTTGWIGEHFEPEDYDVFIANIAHAKVKVKHWWSASLALAKTWKGPVALLYWDTGAPGLEATRQAMRDDFAAWSPHVMPGGVYAVHEPGEYKFGGDALIREAQASGQWEPAVHWAGFIWTMERKAT